MYIFGGHLSLPLKVVAVRLPHPFQDRKDYLCAVIWCADSTQGQLRLSSAAASWLQTCPSHIRQYSRHAAQFFPCSVPTDNTLDGQEEDVCAGSGNTLAQS